MIWLTIVPQQQLLDGSTYWRKYGNWISQRIEESYLLSDFLFYLVCIFLLKFILKYFWKDYGHIILHKHCNIKFVLPVYSFDLNLSSAPKGIIEAKNLKFFWLMCFTSAFPAKPICIYSNKISLRWAEACGNQIRRLSTFSVFGVSFAWRIRFWCISCILFFKQ